MGWVLPANICVSSMAKAVTGWLNSLTWAVPAAVPLAEFRLVADKRTTLEFVIDHLQKNAPAAPEFIELAAGAPFGNVIVSDACTLCMSCTSACPAGALKAAADAPRLSFLERNCLQCGLCANTCPEQAITLAPRLLLKERRAERLLKEAEIFCCTACGKAMGAAPTILNMISKLVRPQHVRHAGSPGASEHVRRLPGD
jgi:NAD-dependent dihydropyrimidine dehydrogenase PreA subunit